MSEPILSRVQVAPFADVAFLADVTGAPDVVASSARIVRVHALEIRYFFDFGASRWVFKVELMGVRIRHDGTAGTSPSVVRYAYGEEMPTWLARIVTQNRPSITLLDLRARRVRST